MTAAVAPSAVPSANRASPAPPAVPDSVVALGDAGMPDARPTGEPGEAGPEVLAGTLDHIVGQLDIMTRTLAIMEQRLSIVEDRILPQQAPPARE